MATGGPTTRRHEVDGDLLEITPLGAGSEVGRSCCVVRFRGKTVMFDCGIHPAHSGMSTLPYFDHINPAEVDILLVTHFHLDHSGSVPYFVNRTEFKGKVFMTHPTRPICKLLWHDYSRVSKIAAEDQIFDGKDVEKTMDRIELVDFHEERQHRGIKFTAYKAGHVLGAAMFMINIGGIRVLYTGDYSREQDRHLPQAELISQREHCLRQCRYWNQVYARSMASQRLALQRIQRGIQTSTTALWRKPCCEKPSGRPPTVLIFIMRHNSALNQSR